MVSYKAAKPEYSFVNALDEPAFVFAPNGEPMHCNMQAKALMTDNGLPFKILPHLKEFTEHLGSFLQNGYETEFSIGGVFYEYDCRPFDGGTLVRFRPLTERDHILRLSASLDNMPWGILTLDTTGQDPVIVYTNRAARDMLSILSHHKNYTLDILYDFGVKECIRDRIYSAAGNHYSFEKRDFKGFASWYRLHFIPYKQRRSYCLMVLEDTTEAKRHEMKYLQSQRLEALGQLAGGVAHDFNNILSIIDGYARMGRKSVAENPDAKNCFERIGVSVERGSAMTSQLLTFGNCSLPPEEINDLGKIIEGQQALLNPLLDASIHLSYKIEHGLVVKATPDQIWQIIINLCVNARDAMPDGGELVVETGCRGDAMAFLRVTDTGVGMPPEVQSKMFDPFFTTKDHGKGTGLGLSVVYGLVQDMNGEIDVLSEPEGGTAITVWLPCMQDISFSSPKTAIQDVPSGLDGKTILIVEDEPDLLNILTKMLDDFGFKVLAATNGNAALALEKGYEGRIDYLLTDVVMPDLNGMKLSSLFRKARPDTKIVFMSGYPAGGQSGRVSLPEDASLLAKPVKMENLVALLQDKKHIFGGRA